MATINRFLAALAGTMGGGGLIRRDMLRLKSDFKGQAAVLRSGFGLANPLLVRENPFVPRLASNGSFVYGRPSR